MSFERCDVCDCLEHSELMTTVDDQSYCDNCYESGEAAIDRDDGE